MALLELSNVTRVYTDGGLLGRRHVHAVDGVSFVVGSDKPEIFAIIGELRQLARRRWRARCSISCRPAPAAFRPGQPRATSRGSISCARSAADLSESV